MTLGWMPEAERIYGLTKYSVGGENKVGICSHTAGGFLSTMRDSSFWNDSVACSVHFAIGLEGEIIQLVNIFDRAWGQGRLNQVSWPRYAEMGYRNPNEYLISIEREDYARVNGRSVFVPNWTEAQYQASLKVHRFCREEIALVKGVDLFKFGIDGLAGHYMFDAVNRVNCPGSVWQSQIRQRLWNDLNTAAIEKGRRDMAIVVLNGGAYFMYGDKIAFIEDPNTLDELRGMVYGNSEAPISQATWDWLFAYGFLATRVR